MQFQLVESARPCELISIQEMMSASRGTSGAGHAPYGLQLAKHRLLYLAEETPRFVQAQIGVRERSTSPRRPHYNMRAVV